MPVGRWRPQTIPVVLADAGVENVNAQVDALIHTGVLRRLLAFTELKFSNSMIEAWWRSLKHQWLFLHSLDSVTTVRRLVAFYVDEHNRALPHSAFREQTPDEIYFGTGDAIPADLTARATAARRFLGSAREFSNSGRASDISADQRSIEAPERGGFQDDGGTDQPLGRSNYADGCPLG